MQYKSFLTLSAIGGAGIADSKTNNMFSGFAVQVMNWSNQISNGGQSAVNWMRNSFRNWNNPVVRTKDQGANGMQEEEPREPVGNNQLNKAAMQGANRSH